MKNNHNAILLLAGGLALLAGDASAQQCSQFTVSAAVGDESTALPSDTVQILMDFPCPGCNMGTFALPASTSFNSMAGARQVQVVPASNYFVVPYQALGTCTVNQTLGCNDCSGSVSAKVYGNKGNISGLVMDISSGAPVSGATVWASAPPSSPTSRATDATGFYTFKLANTGGNNWGVAVSNVANGMGPGKSTYTVDVTSASGTSIGAVAAPVESSKATFVPLYVKHTAVKDPIRCGSAEVPTPSQPTPGAPKGDGAKPKGAPGNCGAPVNLVTGNVWFDHTDASVAAGGVGLSLVRSYNSANRAVTGAFGYGWSHSFGRRLNLSHPQASQRVIELVKADGSMQYYHDRDVDQTYIASYPASNQHWINAVGGNYIRQFQGGGSETYDSTGRLIQETDPQGRTTTYTYTGALLTSVSSGGRTLTLGYTLYFSTNRLTSVTGPGGELLVTYGYGPASANTWDALQRVEYPDGTGYVFHYLGTGASTLLTGVTDLEGKWVERHEYDGSSRGVTSEIGDGVEKLTFAYGVSSTTVTDALGRATTFDWKAFGGLKKVWRVTSPCANCGGDDVQEWTYDSRSRVLTHTDAEGGVTSYTYASETDDRVVSTQFTKPTATPPYTEPATTYEYQSGFLSKVTTPDGAVTEFERNGTGDVTKVKDPLARETALTYSSGKVATVTDPRSKTLTMGYDGTTGDLLTVTDPLNHTTTFAYDNLGRRATVTDALSHTTTTTYSPGGRVAKVTSHDGTFTEFKYDKGGRRSEVIDPLKRSTRYLYDDYGRLTAVIDPAGGVTRYGYDLMTNLASLTDAKDQTTSFEYNDRNQIAKTIYPGGAFETFTYDTLSHLTTMTDRRGIVTTYAYDARSRLVGKSFSNVPTNTPAFTYTYDAAGRMLTAANGTDTLTWAYNSAGELLSEHSAANNSTMAYQYDAGGNRIEVKLDGTVLVTYSYDDASRLTTITRGALNFGFSYDYANRRTGMTYPNGVATSYTYDNLNRLTNLAATHVPTSTPITNFGYQYDAAGNRTQKSTLDFTEDYKYDALDRLARAERTNPGATPPNHWTWGYDAVGNRTSAQKDSEATTSSYNEKNQLLSATGGGAMLWRGALDEPGVATFSAATINGQPARMLSGNVFEAELNLAAGQNTVTIQAQDGSGNVAVKNYSVTVTGAGGTRTYDANGNLAQKVEGADTWVYTWNALNQMTAVTKNGVTQATYGYDPLGRRVAKGVFGTTTTWLYDGEDIAQASAGSTIVQFTHGPGIDEPLAEHTSSATTYLHADALGSIVRHTNSSGAGTQAIAYDSWGTIQGGTPTTFAFTGREWDPETGLYYYRARYYDPTVGRFISEDPSGFAGGDVNLYGYVLGNPANWIDPSGLETFSLNRGLNVIPGVAPPPLSRFDPASHTFVVTTNSDGSLKHTYSWGNKANEKGWNADQAEDVNAAKSALEAGILRPLLLKREGDSGFDKDIEEAFRILRDYGTEHENGWLTNNCKSEAERLIELAKGLAEKRQKQRQ